VVLLFLVTWPGKVGCPYHLVGNSKIKTTPENRGSCNVNPKNGKLLSNTMFSNLIAESFLFADPGKGRV